MAYGVIYILTNIVNKKQYVGKAQETVSINKNKWGANGRWKSHIREALRGDKDHCVLLNNAIRKYGPKNFTVEVLCECSSKEDLQHKEVEYILKHNSMLPNGYNMLLGNKDSIVTLEKKQIVARKKKGTRYSDAHKMNIKLGQMGVRRNPDDKDLPMFVCANRYKGSITSYKINKFPLDIKLQSSFTKDFKTLEEAIVVLEKLQTKHKDVMDMVLNYKSSKDATIKISNKFVANLPEYIYPIVKDNKLAGYYVEGLKDHLGNIIPRKDFVDNTNRWNLDKARRFILQVSILNTSKVTVAVDLIDTLSRRTKRQIDGFYLPKYMSVVFDRQKVRPIGFSVEGIRNKSIGKLPRKQFIVSEYTLQQNYENALAYLEEKKQIYMCQSSS